MPKPITVEMLHAMTPDQRKILHRNASGLDTPAARDVLELLSHDDLMGRPKAVATAAPRKKKAATTTKRVTKAKPAPAAKPIQAKHGRQS